MHNVAGWADWCVLYAPSPVRAEDTVHVLLTTGSLWHSTQGLYIKEGYKTKRSDERTSLIRCETRSESLP